MTGRQDLGRLEYRFVKRCIDVALASALLVVLSPLFAVIALLVRRDGGSILYAHERIGYRGQAFKCLKFRSMTPDADKVLERLMASDPALRREWEENFKLRDDPRVTAIGRFLRRTSLDELPQLVNVLRGDMSMVGPRPIVAEELPRYGEFALAYFRVSPGITGAWQANGRNDIGYDERVRLDVWYVENCCLRNDVAIMLKTVAVILQGRGAY